MPRRFDRVWAATVVGGAVFVLAVPLGLSVQTALVGFGAPPIDVLRRTILLSIVAWTVMCALLCVAVGRRPRSWEYVTVAAVMGALAGLAPVALLVFYRLGYRACVNLLDPLTVAIPDPWHDLIRWAAGAVWAASTALLIVGLIRRPLRMAAGLMWGWSALAVLPVFVLGFLIAYGDPGPGCTPV